MTIKREIIRWVLIATAFVVLLLILWNTYSFFQTYKEEERIKMEIWATASNTLNEANPSDTNLELPLLILTNNTTIPIIQTNERDSILAMVNVPLKVQQDEQEALLFLRKLKNENTPIEVEVGKKKQYLYYGNSSLLLKLKYYPLALILIFIFFTVLIIIFYRSNKIAAQNRLWTGMAKETAHQIGTPLSSLLGWIEIMKLEEINPSIIEEIDKDVKRLQTIADRFSKIGSKPQLTPVDIIAETHKTYAYFQQRSSKQITFEFTAPDCGILVSLNPELHSWTIENLIKNAIDATKGKGKISVLITETGQFLQLYISDTGSGIPKNKFEKIFEPGYTSKKRGWGLGLSLSRRIVEEYQNGKIKVHQSELGKGTTFSITYKKVQL
ncbi:MULTISPECIES: HAMP domain-containing sensor histidine kinase [unclassified Myroides]|uniref:sensor histidine kinase n=1 Tax=unclassified Myroides TaxID=2642485 RepID=UPI0015FC00EE|nr:MULTISPECIES: HAMP domain-containing sensor histidine kinase [unclassified Myroides]MBB1150610.1 ATP-binding protein [Myroides sp. NP-2]MDM1407159.1 ATP-binding protein [Myroides sp. DF42-4-2]